MNDYKDDKWSEDNSDTFLNYGKYFVPNREYQMEIITDLIPACNGQINIVDICCGEGLLCKGILDKFPNSIVHGLDGSEQMKDMAENNLLVYGNRFKFEHIDIFSGDWRTPEYPVHAAVSSLAIHHLNVEEKKKLFKDVYNMLSPGGVFIIADIILPLTDKGRAIAASEWDKAVRENISVHGKTDAVDVFKRLDWNLFSQSEQDPTDKPSTLYEQLTWLRDADFKDIDVYWMRAGHAIFGANK